MSISETQRKTAENLRDESIAASGTTVEWPFASYLSNGLQEIATTQNVDTGLFSGDDPSPWSVQLTNVPWVYCDLGYVYGMDANGRPLFEISAYVSGVWYQSYCTSMKWFQLPATTLWSDLVWYQLP